MFFFFFFNDTATTEIYTLSLHDALPISRGGPAAERRAGLARSREPAPALYARLPALEPLAHRGAQPAVIVEVVAPRARRVVAQQAARLRDREAARARPGARADRG